MKPRDEVIVKTGDWHSGSSVALFPNYQMSFELDKKNTFHRIPTIEQVGMYDHFIKCAKKTKELAKGKKIKVVMNGDAIEGNPHGTQQIMVTSPKHQSQIHVELMENFLDACGFSIKNGDELFYISGTETHTGWEEYGISDKMQAWGAQYSDELRLTINGRRFWWTHEGPKPGKGVKEGNPLRNFAADVYWDCMKLKVPPPHMITTSHHHKNSYESFSDSYAHTVHVEVLPSFQMKTRFGLRVSPFQRNDIGMAFNVVTAEGDIRVLPPMLWGGMQ